MGATASCRETVRKVCRLWSKGWEAEMRRRAVKRAVPREAGPAAAATEDIGGSDVAMCAGWGVRDGVVSNRQGEARAKGQPRPLLWRGVEGSYTIFPRETTMLRSCNARKGVGLAQLVRAWYL